jgi:hypothetical protein
VASQGALAEHRRILDVTGRASRSTPGNPPAAPKLDEDRSREELLSENARLRTELLRRRSNSPMWPVVAGLAAHIALRPIFDPWLNSSSDGKVDLAIVVLAAPIALSAWALVRALRSRQD